MSLDYHHDVELEVRGKAQFRILEPSTPFSVLSAHNLALSKLISSDHEILLNWQGKGAKKIKNTDKNKDKNISKEKKDGQNSSLDSRYDTLTANVTRL